MKGQSSAEHSFDFAKPKIDWAQQTKAAWASLLDLPHFNPRRRSLIIGSPGFWLLYLLFMYCVYVVFVFVVGFVLAVKFSFAICVSTCWGVAGLRNKIQAKQALKAESR